MNWNFLSRLGSMRPADRVQLAARAPRGWFVLAGVPVGIIALYFLKLRRRPVQVPSTLLWRRSLEDLHVNSLFQRLRRNLLLFLQLLAVALAMLALAGPRIKGTGGQGQRYVLMIDNSASMSATDVAPSRLAQAKEEARKVVCVDGRRRPGDGHLVRRDRPGSSRTTRATAACCSQRIDAIEPTQSTHLAPRGAPGRGRAGQPVEADRRGRRRHLGPDHAQAHDLHRRRLPRRRGVQPGQPRARGGRDRPAAAPLLAAGRGHGPGRRQGQGPEPVGQRGDRRPPDPASTTRSPTSTSSSAASTTSAPRRSTPRPSSTATTPTSPATEGTLIDAIALKLPPAERPVVQVRPARHRARRARGAADGQGRPRRSTTAPTPSSATPRKAQVLAVTAGQPLPARHLQHADRRRARRRDGSPRPRRPRRRTLAREIRGGRFDLVIYDGVRPERPPRPTPSISAPCRPGPAYAKPKAVEQPVILDWDISHPLMQYIRDLSLVFVAKANLRRAPRPARRP